MNYIKQSYTFFALFFLVSILTSCEINPLDNNNNNNGPLPKIGNHPDLENGVYHVIPPFSFINQDSAIITNQTFDNKIYISDFFFTSCPTTCPKVKKQMLRIYEKYANDDRLLLLSHSIDTKYDTVPALKKYADKLEIKSDRWHLVTGDHDEIYGIANDYVSVAIVDGEAPGGFNHSGRLILIDKDKHIRSFCDGTDQESVTKFMKDIDKLLREMEEKE